MTLKDLLTEKDGESTCVVRVAFAIGLLAYIGFTMSEYFSDAKFSFMVNAKDWIKGLAEYVGLGGAAIAGKNYTETPGQ